MKNKKNFLRQLLQAGNKKNAFKQKTLINPMREWAICLVVTVCVACGLFSYTGYNFYVHFGGVDEKKVSDTESVVYKRDEAALLITQYKARATKFEALQNEVRGVRNEKVEETVLPTDEASNIIEKVDDPVPEPVIPSGPPLQE